MSMASKTKSTHARAIALIKAKSLRVWLLTLLALSSAQSANAGAMFVDGLEEPTSSDIAWLGDEFDAAETLLDLRRIWQAEHWPFDAMQQFNINQKYDFYRLNREKNIYFY